MIVLLLEKVPVSLRGELTRWFLEPKAGVFVGRVSGQVRDLIWDQVCDKLKAGGAIMLHPTNNEQGFEVRLHGATTKELVDYEGLVLFCRPFSTEQIRSRARVE